MKFYISVLLFGIMLWSFADEASTDILLYEHGPTNMSTYVKCGESAKYVTITDTFSFPYSFQLDSIIFSNGIYPDLNFVVCGSGNDRYFECTVRVDNFFIPGKNGPKHDGTGLGNKGGIKIEIHKETDGQKVRFYSVGVGILEETECNHEEP